MSDDGGPAFPMHSDVLPPGMGLRDWFAGLAMQGMLASGSQAPDDRLAAEAYAAADAMLEARK
jgi:hypothetical protein